MAFTNTSPMMYPTRSSRAALGTNPLTLAAKAKNDAFILDMATTTAALGKVCCYYSLSLSLYWYYYVYYVCDRTFMSHYFKFHQVY